MNSLSSKTIIITGGSIGIGFAVAKKCAKEGANVIIAARNKDDLSTALNSLRNVSKKEHDIYSLDVSNYDEVKDFTKWIKHSYKEIHGLVNCAGVYGPIGKTPTVDIDQFKNTININFLGTVYMCTSLNTLFSNNKRKKIVNFSGGGAATPFPNYSAYATSKVAIVRFTENLALELSNDDFDVNCIAPGFVVTRIHKTTIDAGEEAAGTNFFSGTKKQIESGGVPPEKAANLATFLLSDKSNGITGKFISAPWDAWDEKSFQDLLRTDKDFATLRRIDNKTFFKKT